MDTSIKYSVQIIKGQDQLTEALNLRYKVYRKVYPRLFKDNDTQTYESDAFDGRSIHLGLYCENDFEKKLAGYCRLILPKFFSKAYSHVLINAHPNYVSEDKNAAEEKLAMLRRMPYNYQLIINSFCDDLENQNKQYIETSRFIIDEEHRSFSLSAFFVSSMFAVSESLNIKFCFFECSHHHTPFYSKYGLTLFPGIAPYDDDLFGNQYVIFGTDLEIVKARQNTIKSFILQLGEENQITFKRAA